MSYEDAISLHDMLIERGIVRVQTNASGSVWWVEYADRKTGRWKLVSFNS